MLVTEPENRMSFEEFFKHPWVSGKFRVSESNRKLSEEEDINTSLKMVHELHMQKFGKNHTKLLIKGRGKQEIVLMMKISFQLRKFLEKSVIGFLASCNNFKDLFSEKYF